MTNTTKILLGVGVVAVGYVVYTKSKAAAAALPAAPVAAPAPPVDISAAPSGSPSLVAAKAAALARAMHGTLEQDLGSLGGGWKR